MRNIIFLVISPPKIKKETKQDEAGAAVAAKRQCRKRPISSARWRRGLHVAGHSELFVVLPPASSCVGSAIGCAFARIFGPASQLQGAHCRHQEGMGDRTPRCAPLAMPCCHAMAGPLTMITKFTGKLWEVVETSQSRKTAQRRAHINVPTTPTHPHPQRRPNHTLR
jgi:hypothetical protein